MNNYELFILILKAFKKLYHWTASKLKTYFTGLYNDFQNGKAHITLSNGCATIDRQLTDGRVRKVSVPLPALA